MISRDDSKQLLQKILTYSKAEGCQLTLIESHIGNIRYARNTVTTSGNRKNISVSVMSYFGKKSGTITVNEFDDASLEGAVRQSEELSRLAPENPEFMEPLGPQTYQNSEAYSEATANITPDFRAKSANESIQTAVENNATAAGFMEDTARVTALMNSKGLFAYNGITNVNLLLTMRTDDGTGSGWATQDFNDASFLKAMEASQVAIQKALQSKNPRTLEPGKYTVILEAPAAAELIQNMVFNMGARAADEGRSFLSKKGGGTKLGEKIVDERVHIYSDPFHAMSHTVTASSEGMPIQKQEVIKNGTVSNLYNTRYWAAKMNVPHIPFYNNIIMDGGSTSIDDMVKGTKKGVLVTRFWYIRSVDPQTQLYTGLTRDGVFFLENGKIKFPIKNFRFNESPVIMLNNLEALGKQHRLDRALSPAQGGTFVIPDMMIRDFTFTSLSDAV
jgi:predicted Zn-dependent protease